jgi:hypothetical protein
VQPRCHEVKIENRKLEIGNELRQIVIRKSYLVNVAVVSTIYPSARCPNSQLNRNFPLFIANQVRFVYSLNNIVTSSSGENPIRRLPMDEGEAVAITCELPEILEVESESKCTNQSNMWRKQSPLLPPELGRYSSALTA